MYRQNTDIINVKVMLWQWAEENGHMSLRRPRLSESRRAKELIK
jgi:hypothetical protein